MLDFNAFPLLVHELQACGSTRGFMGCSILLTKPEKDLWSPLPLAELFLKRVKKVDVKIVVLENAGRYPLEQPGRGKMHEAILSFLKGVRIGFLVMFEFLSLLD
jgi:hypothetical protein